MLTDFVVEAMRRNNWTIPLLSPYSINGVKPNMEMNEWNRPDKRVSVCPLKVKRTIDK
jgi:hypothetical protein